MKTRFFAVVACSCLALLARPALANGDVDLDDANAAPKAQATTPSTSDDDADLAVKLPNFQGLSGMQDMIDARIPQGLTIRGGLRMEQQKEDLHGHLLEFNRDRYDLQAYAGVAALELFEVGARLPFELNHTTRGWKVDGGHTRESGSGLGDLDLGGKISIRLGPVALAPYVIGTLPTGSHFDHMTGAKLGGAATISVFKSRINFHANVDGAWVEGGQWAIDYRVGVSVVPVATKILLLRPYVFLNAKQNLGNDPGADMRVAAGVQGLLFDFITVEAGGSYRFLSEATPHDLEQDTGTWSIHVGAGVAF